MSEGADKWLVLVLVSKESGYSLVILPSVWSWANLTSLGLDFHICKIRDLYPLSFQNENVKVLRWDYIFPKSKLRINSSTFAINCPVSKNRCSDRKVCLLTLGKCQLNWHCYIPENWVLSRWQVAVVWPAVEAFLKQAEDVFLTQRINASHRMIVTFVTVIKLFC